MRFKISLFLATFFACSLQSQIETKSFAFENPARGIDVIATQDQGFLFTGNTFSIKTRLASAILIKTDSNGNVLWKNEYSSESKSNFGWSLAEIPDGYLILGFTEDKKRSKALIIKTDFTGKLVWRKELGTNQNQIVWSITKRNNELICVGETSGANGKKQVWLFATDFNGNLVWEKIIESDEKNERVFYVDQTDNNHYVATGTSTSGTKEEDDILVLKFDDTGQVLWKNILQSEQGRDVGHAVKFEDEYIYVYGYSEVEKGFFNPVVIQMNAKGKIKRKLTITHERDIRIMNGIKNGTGHTLIGYSKKQEDKFFQLSIIKIDNGGMIKDFQNIGVEGLNTGYSIKKLNESESVITGAIITNEKTRKSEVVFIKSKNR